MVEIKQNPCNCETCDKNGGYMPFASDCPFNGYDYTPGQIERITMRCGCLYHPKAMKYLKSNNTMVKKHDKNSNK
jgi:hypothetical protein